MDGYNWYDGKYREMKLRDLEPPLFEIQSAEGSSMHRSSELGGNLCWSGNHDRMTTGNAVSFIVQLQFIALR